MRRPSICIIEVRQFGSLYFEIQILFEYNTLTKLMTDPVMKYNFGEDYFQGLKQDLFDRLAAKPFWMLDIQDNSQVIHMQMDIEKYVRPPFMLPIISTQELSLETDDWKFSSSEGDQKLKSSKKKPRALEKNKRNERIVDPQFDYQEAQKRQKSKKIGKKGKKPRPQHPTKNFLQDCKNLFLYYLMNFFQQEFFNSIEIIQIIKAKKWITLPEFQKLLNEPLFKVHLKEYFENKQIYRDLLLTGINYEKKQFYQRILCVFEIAFIRGKFKTIDYKYYSSLMG